MKYLLQHCFRTTWRCWHKALLSNSGPDSIEKDSWSTCRADCSSQRQARLHTVGFGRRPNSQPTCRVAKGHSDYDSDKYHATIWQTQCHHLTKGMLPSEKNPAAIWQIPCQHLTSTLPPSVIDHAAIWQGPCHHLTGTIPPSDKYDATIWQNDVSIWQMPCRHLTKNMPRSDKHHTAIWYILCHHMTNTMLPSDN